MPRSDRRGARACSSSLARPARALAPTVEALPLMVCRVAALPGHRPRRAGVRAGRRGPACRNEAPQHLDDQLQAAAETPDDIAPRLDQFARVRCRCRRARRRSCRDDRAGKAPGAPCRSASPHGRSCPPPGGFAVGQRGVGGHGGIGSPAKRPSARILRVASDHRYPASACPSAPRRTARSPPAPAERPPAPPSAGPPGRPRCSTARRRRRRFSALSSTHQQTHAPTAAGARSTGRAAGWPDAPCSPCNACSTESASCLGVTGLVKIDEGRRAVVARIGQHLAAIGGDHDHHGRRQVALQLADQLRRAGSRRDRACANPISTTS